MKQKQRKTPTKKNQKQGRKKRKQRRKKTRKEQERERERKGEVRQAREKQRTLNNEQKYPLFQGGKGNFCLNTKKQISKQNKIKQKKEAKK